MSWVLSIQILRADARRLSGIMPYGHKVIPQARAHMRQKQWPWSNRATANAVEVISRAAGTIAALTTKWSNRCSNK